MKKVLVSTSLSCLIVASSFASEYRYNFSVSPLGFLIGNVNAKVEAYQIRKGFVPAVEGSYWSFSSGGADYSAWTLGLSGRFYKDKVSFSGWFGQLGVEIGRVSVDTDLYGSGSSTVFGLYGIGGYRWSFGSEGKFTVDVGIGAGYYRGSVEVNGETFDAFQGILPKGLLAIGVNF